MLILLVLLLVNPAECAGVHFVPLRQNGKDTYVTNRLLRVNVFIPNHVFTRPWMTFESEVIT